MRDHVRILLPAAMHMRCSFQTCAGLMHKYFVFTSEIGIGADPPQGVTCSEEGGPLNFFLFRNQDSVILPENSYRNHHTRGDQMGTIGVCTPRRCAHVTP